MIFLCQLTLKNYMGYRLPSFCFHTFNIFRQLRFINPLSVSSSWCQFFRGHNHSKPFCFNKSQYLSSPPSLLLQNTYHGVLMYFLCQVGSPSFCSLSLSFFFCYPVSHSNPRFSSNCIWKYLEIWWQNYIRKYYFRQ